MCRSTVWNSSREITGNEDPDYFPLTLISHILGGGLQSRLYKKLQEESETFYIYKLENQAIFREFWRQRAHKIAGKSQRSHLSRMENDQGTRCHRR
ncbi:MAG: insulinase family protein [Holosporales bacterium]|nr:insulinase family protein [Holosporales bacterium]